ncbi:glycosyltransferase [Aerophototrophica crusticola]|uniref:Glycosyltransferase n=1 Tax=Aerophototrophica crusticola TaxID=1709002 RepID=A0A858R5C9_9PROT|nr:glycosyltransferase [Rhodospirillaceae bacterium B3]
MKLVVFGLTISSSWGNGHATLWRGLCAALARLGHTVVFFEKDQYWYANNRDLWELPGGELVLYQRWEEALPIARRHLADADASMVTSYCPDGIAATELVLEEGRSLRTFYDLDTPVTLAALDAGEELSYIGPGGLSGFDLVLSYTGGEALTALQRRLGARAVAPLYGHVDPSVHRPVPRQDHYRADLSYIGTYAEDRQQALETLFVQPARALPRRRFLIAGSQYPQDFPWTDNIWFVRHLPPSEHPAFFCSSRLTLNVTRAAMAAMGWCPSGRLFEAAACGAPILSDWWQGLDAFLVPGEEILVARTADEARAAIDLPDADLRRVAAAARAKVLDRHTSDARALDLLAALEGARRPARAPNTGHARPDHHTQGG